MRRSFLLALSCSLALSACGGDAATTDAGYSAMRDGDYAGAVETFDKVLAGMDKSAEGFKEACLGRIQALAHVDADKAKETFLAEAAGGGMDARDYSALVDELYSANQKLVAIDVLDAGKKALPEDATIQAMLEKALADAAKNPDGDVAAALAGMGYLGGE